MDINILSSILELLISQNNLRIHPLLHFHHKSKVISLIGTKYYNNHLYYNTSILPKRQGWEVSQ